jgi:hypothetical protein
MKYIGLLYAKIEETFYSAFFAQGKWAHGISAFMILSILLSSYGDFSYLFFLWVMATNPQRFAQMMKEMPSIVSQNPVLTNPSTLETFRQLFVLAILVFIVFTFLSNALAYISLWRKRTYGIRYMKQLALIGMILFPWTIQEARTHSTLWIAVFAITLPFYAFIWFGLNVHFDHVTIMPKLKKHIKNKVQ